jgi:hypothetical protein
MSLFDSATNDTVHTYLSLRDRLALSLTCHAMTSGFNAFGARARSGSLTVTKSPVCRTCHFYMSILEDAPSVSVYYTLCVNSRWNYIYKFCSPGCVAAYIQRILQHPQQMDTTSLTLNLQTLFE